MFPQHTGSICTHTHTYKTQIIKQVIHLNHTVLDPCHCIDLTGGESIHTNVHRLVVERIKNYYRQSCQVVTSTRLHSFIWHFLVISDSQRSWRSVSSWGTHARQLNGGKGTDIHQDHLSTAQSRWVSGSLLFQQIWAVCCYLNTKWFQFGVWERSNTTEGANTQNGNWRG